MVNAAMQKRIEELEAQLAGMQQSANANDVIQKYNTNPLGQYAISYDPNTAQNLSQVGAMTGQNIEDIGQASEQYRNLIQKRLSGQDEGSRYIQQQSNRNLANVARSYSGRDVAGGATLASQNEAQMAGSQSAAKSMQDFEGQNMSLLKTERDRNQQATASAIASGQQMFQASQTPVFNGGSGGGTVICTELYRQGYINDQDYEKDVQFGGEVQKVNPFMIEGYRMLATPIAEKMKESHLLTVIAAFFAVPWAKGMNRDNGAFYQAIALFYMTVFCIPLTLVGLLFSKKTKKA